MKQWWEGDGRVGRGKGGVRSTQIKWHADQIHNELFLKQLTTDGSNARPNNNNSRAKRNWVNRRREWLEKGLGTGSWELGAGQGKGLRLVVETGLETGRGFVCWRWGWELPLSKSKTFANCRRHLTASWSAEGGQERRQQRHWQRQLCSLLIAQATKC